MDLPMLLTLSCQALDGFWRGLVHESCYLDFMASRRICPSQSTGPPWHLLLQFLSEIKLLHPEFQRLTKVLLLAMAG